MMIPIWDRFYGLHWLFARQKAGQVTESAQIISSSPRGIRGFRVKRCDHCWMEKSLCVCSELPRIKTKTRVVIAMEYKESLRASNTGRLAQLVLENSEVRLRGSPWHVFNEEGLIEKGMRSLVLFPHESAKVLTAEHDPLTGADKGKQQATTLVVLDGTWRWARRAFLHVDVFRSMETVKLPESDLVSSYNLRSASKKHHLCTYESLAKALSLLEGPQIEKTMMPVFHAMVKRTMKFRGLSEK